MQTAVSSWEATVHTLRCTLTASCHVTSSRTYHCFGRRKITEHLPPFDEFPASTPHPGQCANGSALQTAAAGSCTTENNTMVRPTRGECPHLKYISYTLPETTQQSREWRHSSLPKPWNLKPTVCQWSHGKCFGTTRGTVSWLSTCWDNSKCVNADRYCEMPKKHRKPIRMWDKACWAGAQAFSKAMPPTCWPSSHCSPATLRFEHHHMPIT